MGIFFPFLYSFSVSPPSLIEMPRAVFGRLRYAEDPADCNPYISVTGLRLDNRTRDVIPLICRYANGARRAIA